MSLYINHPRGHLGRISNLFMICYFQPQSFHGIAEYLGTPYVMGTQQNQNELKEECIRFKHGMKQYPRTPVSLSLPGTLGQHSHLSPIQV